ncbi:MAG: GNAT family N-acetyltransferase [Calothrix sp. MO_192.B10]|nr:GNAT family N-acetyltransferase [Calothrix sp. MO_192.B10]
MPVPKNINYRQARVEEDSLIAEHFYYMWQDNQVAPENIISEWLNVTVEFINRARQELSYQAFVAELSGKVIASAGCQLFAGLYPHILTNNYRKYGYIWGVYVEPPHRNQGIAKQLMGMSINHLKAIGCTRTILHASPSGKPVYSSLGFSSTNEMRLDLI